AGKPWDESVQNHSNRAQIAAIKPQQRRSARPAELRRSDQTVLAGVQLKINLLAPTEGDALIATGQVERAGRRLTVCRSDVHAVGPEGTTHVATALGTFMTMVGLEPG
ncbi:MAG: PaaI family thioesterase, partial [Pseudomonadota bacterium]